jgi:hypothetical protein
MSLQSVSEASLKTKTFSKGEMMYNQGSTARQYPEVVSFRLGVKRRHLTPGGVTQG